MVTAWGESAGAGSIMHHLVFQGGRMDPLFHQINVQSPAFQAVQDRCGTVEAAYQQFADLLGCGDEGLACLREQSPQALRAANLNTTAGGRPGAIGYGPVPDRTLIRQLAQFELASGNYFRGIRSVITQHVFDEAATFVNPNITNEKGFNKWLDTIYPTNNIGRWGIAAIKKQYPSGLYANETFRVNAATRDSSFTCNNRYIAEAYADRTWNSQYSVDNATHGADITATFFNNTEYTSSGKKGHEPWEVVYQKYFVSHARTGNPNTYKSQNSLDWPMSRVYYQQTVPNVLDVKGRTGFALIHDTKVPKDKCDFWRDLNWDLQAAFPQC
jgi:carboxylesterase type B